MNKEIIVTIKQLEQVGYFASDYIIDALNSALILNKPLLIELKQSKDKKSKLHQQSQGLRKISQPEYLLFLKKRKDGTYEPVSGQLDASFSVRAMFPPENISIR